MLLIPYLKTKTYLLVEINVQLFNNNNSNNNNNNNNNSNNNYNNKNNKNNNNNKNNITYISSVKFLLFVLAKASAKISHTTLVLSKTQGNKMYRQGHYGFCN